MLPAGEMQIRITLLDDALYPCISQFFLQHLNSVPLLRLGRSMLAVSRVMTTPESGEPWAGFARFDELLARASEHETTWHIQFVTPTAFKTGDAAMPLPVPRLCFQSWLNSWDEHAPLPFFQDKLMRRAFLADVVEWGVSVTYDHLRLVQAPLYFDGARTREQGFVGTCRFTAKSSKITPVHRKILATLAAYSYYTGTGRKTTMGMGLTRRL
jgi:CRISPR-associated endoribonuclease Cas6